MYFNPAVKFTQVDFKRDKEGRYVHFPHPLVVADYEDINSWGNGRLDIGGESVLVEEDHEQISAIIDGKIKEKEVYEASLRKEDRTGMEGEEADA